MGRIEMFPAVKKVSLDEFVAKPLRHMMQGGGKTPPSNPDNGMYWVKRRGSQAWVPAKLFEGFWQFIGEIAMFPSDDIAQIGPRLIPPSK
jgi:hypothetical protein